jgi:hypothetical protein
MYNFFYGDRQKIEADEFGYVLSVKRMLPRFLNSLPDKSFRFIHEILSAHVTREKPVMVETGIGASTILLLHHAMKTGGHVYSWDTNSSKASALHQVCSETICGYHGLPVSEFWTFVSSDSTSEHTGISLLPELAKKVDFSVHDSNHTWKVIEHEVTGVIRHMGSGSVICVDDANQTAVHTYEPIINVTRRKLGLDLMKPIPGNQGKPHYEELPKLYGKYFKVEELRQQGTESFKDDLYYAWYSNDRSAMNSVGMERFGDHETRFVAHRMLEKIR